MKISLQRQIIDNLKDSACVDCGGKFPPYCMDFDHRNPSDKIGNIAHMLHAPIDLLLTEIEKCDIVCSNCHRIRSHSGYGIREGIAVARKRGKCIGRPERVVDKDKIFFMRESGATYAEIASVLGVSIGKVYRVVNSISQKAVKD